ncbi:MAG: enoyl-CoA hydratase/isomerase family protein [Sphingomonadales bacterium]|nr:MAG: enoyl-CoA hydratase/isomerase family protein [Sphingomonadales bacterium]
MTGKIHVSHPARGVTQIFIDCPPANALGAEPLSELIVALEQAERDESVRAVVLAGREGAFCAGADLRGLAEGASWEELSTRFARVIDLVEQLRAPVIAAIDGHALGGGFELALACDIRVASERAFFVGAAVNVGLVASVYRLPRLIGVARAKAILLTGERVDAQTALHYGIVTEVAAGSALPAALRIAERIATRAPLSVEASKRLINQAPDLTRDAFDRIMQPELDVLVNSNDHREALDAFQARRQPEFTRT